MLKIGDLDQFGGKVGYRVLVGRFICFKVQWKLGGKYGSIEISNCLY